MAALYQFSAKAKAIILLLSVIVGHLHRITQTLVKIVDDSELTVNEAIDFARQEGPIWVGEWNSRKTKDE